MHDAVEAKTLKLMPIDTIDTASHCFLDAAQAPDGSLIRVF